MHILIALSLDAVLALVTVTLGLIRYFRRRRRAHIQGRECSWMPSWIANSLRIEKALNFEILFAIH
jgi:hypothetical protein